MSALREGSRPPVAGRMSGIAHAARARHQRSHGVGCVRRSRRFPAKPAIVARDIIEILGDAERFCFHMAAEMKRADAEEWIAQVRRKALANAKRALAPLLTKDVASCAIVAREGAAGISTRCWRRIRAYTRPRDASIATSFAMPVRFR